MMGADIRQVVVLDRGGGRAVDDFIVDLRTKLTDAHVASALEQIPGVCVEGVRWVSWVPAMFSDAALVGQIAANPARGLVTLVDAVPQLLTADWAAVVRITSEGTEVLHTSIQAPDPLNLPELTPTRPRAFTTSDGIRGAAAPLGSAPLALVVARDSGPVFRRVEVERLAHILDAVAATLGGWLGPLAHPTVSAELTSAGSKPGSVSRSLS